MEANDKYLVQLRRELTRSQSRLAKAEQDRDRLLAVSRALRKIVEENGIALPRRLREVDGSPRPRSGGRGSRA